MKINPYAPSEEVFNKAFGNVLNTNSINKVNKLDNETEGNVGSASFADVLKSSLNEVNNKQIIADNLTDSFTKGEDGVDITDVMLATAEANTSLQFAVQVRNKLVDAYQEIVRMQI